MCEEVIKAKIEHRGTDDETNDLWSSLRQAGFFMVGGISYEETKTGSEMGVFHVEIENAKPALKQLKAWIKASRFTAKVIV